MRKLVLWTILGAWTVTAAAVAQPSSSNRPLGIGDPILGVVTTPSQEPMSLFCTPGGTGHPFDQASTYLGGQGDATIFLQLDEPISGAPLAMYPAEDMWLIGTAGGLVACSGGTAADHDTDVEGRTFWSLPLRAGGHLDPDEGERLVIELGTYSIVEGSLDHLRFNSADIDGDGRVNLTDVGFFNSDLGGSAYRSDFHWDGVVNLSDAGLMAAALGAACP